MDTDSTPVNDSTPPDLPAGTSGLREDDNISEDPCRPTDSPDVDRPSNNPGEPGADTLMAVSPKDGNISEDPCRPADIPDVDRPSNNPGEPGADGLMAVSPKDGNISEDPCRPADSPDVDNPSNNPVEPGADILTNVSPATPAPWETGSQVVETCGDLPDVKGSLNLVELDSPLEIQEVSSGAEETDLGTQRQESGADIAGLGFGGVELMEGECVDVTLNLKENRGERTSFDHNVVLLTDRRLVQLRADSRRRSTVFVSLRDIDAVEVTKERHGYSGFIWGGLAVFVAVLLVLLWDHPVGSVTAAVAVTLMGAYLVFDHVTSSRRVVAVFKTGASQLECDLDVDTSPGDVHHFLNRMFTMKEQVRE